MANLGLKKPTFFVVEIGPIRSIGPGQFILGRAGDVDLSLGTVFSSIDVARHEVIGDEMLSYAVGEPISVSLELTKIYSCGKGVDQIAHGHSAAVQLKGEGTPALIRAFETLAHQYTVYLSC